MSLPIHICNKSQEMESNFDTIDSFKNFDDCSFSNVPYILLNIHLSWENTLMSLNLGFQIAQEVRVKKKYKKPIIFYSPLTQTFFEEKAKTNIKYKLLFGRGSSFVQIPTDIKNVESISEKINPLSNAALIDITTMLCDIKGMILDKLNHNLKITNKPIEVINEVIPYLSKEQLLNIRADEYGNKLSNLIKYDNISDFFKIKKEFIDLCSLWLGVKEATKKIITKNKPDILLVDDETEVLDKIEQNLESEFNIYRTTSGAEALSILQKDTSNSIMAIIADWRLYKDSSNTKWQPYQGYEVLEIAAKTGFRTLIALTSQPEYIVNQIRNSLGIRFVLFKKDEVIYNGNWSILSTILKESIEEQISIVSAIPSAATRWWGNMDNKKNKVIVQGSLFYQYLKAMHSVNKTLFFKEIDQKCDEIWSYLMDNYLINGNFDEVEDIRERYSLKKTDKNPMLFDVLVLRRIWLALWYKEHDDAFKISQEEILENKINIFKIISEKKQERNNEESSAKAEITKLCIVIHQIRNYQILPEEKSWLLSKPEIGLDNLK